MPTEKSLREIMVDLFCRNHLHAELMKWLAEMLHHRVEVEVPIENREGKEG